MSYSTASASSGPGESSIGSSRIRSSCWRCSMADAYFGGQYIKLSSSPERRISLACQCRCDGASDPVLAVDPALKGALRRARCVRSRPSAVVKYPVPQLTRRRDNSRPLCQARRKRREGPLDVIGARTAIGHTADVRWSEAVRRLSAKNGHNGSRLATLVVARKVQSLGRLIDDKRQPNPVSNQPIHCDGSML